MRYEEHEILGGDYRSIFRTDENKLFLCICDVTGRNRASRLCGNR